MSTSIGKVIVDITNTFDPPRTGLLTPDGISGAQEIAKAAPGGRGRRQRRSTPCSATSWPRIRPGAAPLDVFIADDDGAKACVSSFIDSLAVRPLDAGDLTMAHGLEGADLLMVAPALGKAVNDHNFWLGINTVRLSAPALALSHQAVGAETMSPMRPGRIRGSGRRAVPAQNAHTGRRW